MTMSKDTWLHANVEKLEIEYNSLLLINDSLPATKDNTFGIDIIIEECKNDIHNLTKHLSTLHQDNQERKKIDSERVEPPTTLAC